MYLFTLVVLLISLAFQLNAYKNDEPLILTPFIEAGDIESAKRFSQVTQLPNTDSYAGFFTLNKVYDSNLFFWLIVNQNESAPLLVVLGGGPGDGSFFTNFVETGPLILTNGASQKREYAWANNYHMLYVDNPVGAGYSFTNSTYGYARDMCDVSSDFIKFLRQFFTMFTEYSTNDFYITGESYAGKYIPAIAAKLIRTPDIPVNFKGIAMGNAIIDPSNQYDYASLLYQVSFIDGKQRDELMKIQQNILTDIKNYAIANASYLFETTMEGVLYGPSWFANATGQPWNHDFTSSSYVHFEPYAPLINGTEWRQALHVGNAAFNDSSDVVFKYLFDDLANSEAADFVAVLESGARVLLYSGSIDVIVGAPFTQRFLWNLKWKGSKDWQQAKKDIWKVDEKQAKVSAYVKTASNLTFAIVRNAGHNSPWYKPKEVFTIVEKFINDEW